MQLLSSLFKLYCIINSLKWTQTEKCHSVRHLDDFMWSLGKLSPTHEYVQLSRFRQYLWVHMFNTNEINVLDLSLNLLQIPFIAYHCTLLIQEIFTDLMNEAMYSVGEMIALQTARTFFFLFLKRTCWSQGIFFP